MRIRKLAAAVALGVAALGLSACAEYTQHRGFALSGDAGAAGPDLHRRARSAAMAASGGLEFQRYAGDRRPAAPGARLSPGGQRRRARTWSSSSAMASISGQTRIVDSTRFYGSRFGYGGLDSPFFYPRFGYRRVALLLRLERSVLVRRRASTAMSNITASSTSTSAPPAPTSRCSTAAPRRARRPTGSTCSSRAWSKRCSPASRARTAKLSRSPSRPRPGAPTL